MANAEFSIYDLSTEENIVGNPLSIGFVESANSKLKMIKRTMYGRCGKEKGYDIRQGKNLAFRAPEQKNFTNMKSLGSYYTEENVLLRLEKNRHKTKIPRNVSREVRLFINISSYVSTGNRAGFERWPNSII